MAGKIVVKAGTVVRIVNDAYGMVVTGTLWRNAYSTAYGVHTIILSDGWLYRSEGVIEVM